MDRLIYNPAQILQDTDLGNMQRNSMIAHGYALQMLLGTGTIVDGLACLPTTPASMTVTVGQGSIISLATVDQSVFGSLPLDNTDPLVKMGINAFGSTSFTLAAPGTSGQSINYLIQATFQETDTGSTVLSYFNPANPSQPYSGPNNTGVAQNTQRAQKVELQLKAGAAANTGTQTTPAVDAGWVGLYVITVNYGQVTVTSGSISQYPGAPFLPAKVPAMSWGSALWADTGTANTYAATLNPAPANLAALKGITIKVRIANASTGASTFNPNGLGNTPIVNPDGSAIANAQMPANGIATMIYDGSSFQLALRSSLIINRQVFSNSGTYSPTAGMLYADVEVLGGGGAGGGASLTNASQVSFGAGGGAGGYCKGRFSAATIGASRTVTIGAGGTGVSGGAGNPGGNTTFGTLLTGGAGAGGNSSNVISNTASFVLGAVFGGTATGGDVTVQGEYSSPGFTIAGVGWGGQGGSTVYGSGGSPAYSNVPGAGTIAVGYGSGGGGAFIGVSSAAVAGGNGAAGVCIVTEYILH